MKLVEFDTSKINNAHELFNSAKFIDRVYSFLTGFGMEINYGDFVSKFYKNGMVRLLKSLGLYKTIGRGGNKKTYIDYNLHFIVDTTIKDANHHAKSIIRLMDGGYAFHKYEKTPPKEYFSLPCGLQKRQAGNYATYIILNPNNSLYKVGVSKNIYDRLTQLKREVSPDLKIIAVCEKNHEREIHFKYREVRQFGEWFSLSTDDVLDIFNEFKFKSFTG